MNLKEFIKQYRVVLFLSFFFFLFSYSIKIFTYSYSIDTEIYMLNKNLMLDSWLMIHRFSLVFLKEILGWIPFSIFWTNLFTVIFFYLGCVIFFFTILQVSRKFQTPKHAYYFFLTLSTSCVFLEQFHFVLQSLEVGITFVLFEIGLFFWVKYGKENKLRYLLFSFFLLTFSLGCYQAFAAMFITEVLIFTFLRIQEEKLTGKESMIFLIKSAILLGVSYISYSIIAKIVLSITHLESGGYLETQIGWLHNPLLTNIKNILKSGVRLYFGSFFSYPSFSILNTVLLIGMFISIYKFIKKKKYFSSLILLGIFLSPLCLTILLGNAEPIRASLSMGIVTSFGVLYFLNDKKWVSFIFLICIGIQCFTMLSYQQSDYKRYLNDVSVAEDIYRKIHNDLEGRTVVFIGSYETDQTGEILKSEVMGRSFFNYWGSSERAIGFMNSLGLNVNGDYGYVEEGAKIMEEKPSYPDEESILVTDSHILIKLS